MSAAFGWTVPEVERHVVALIQSGDINGRVDSQNKVCLRLCSYAIRVLTGESKILQAKTTDHRSELFDRAIKAGNEMQSANRKLLLRMRL